MKHAAHRARLASAWLIGRWALYGAVLGAGAPIGLWLLLWALAPAPERVIAVAYLYTAVGTVAVFVLFGVVAGIRMRRLRETSVRDPLTGLCNRRFLDELVPRLLAGARRHHRPLALLMIDLDRFKRVNDRFGHAVGDRTLSAIADALEPAMRQADLVGRFGGEEFVAVCPDTGARPALEAAERLRRACRDLSGRELGWEGPQTVSIGVAVFDPEKPETASALLRRADSALYLAKEQGRDRVVLSGRPAAAVSVIPLPADSGSPSEPTRLREKGRVRGLFL